MVRLPATTIGRRSECGNVADEETSWMSISFGALRLTYAACTAAATNEAFYGHRFVDLLPCSLLSFGDYRVPSGDGGVGSVNVQKAVHRHERITS